MSEQLGTIHAFTVTRDGVATYTVADHEIIDLVKNIPNRDDDGSLTTDTDAIGKRQVTGLLVTGTASAPVLYVSSSDPRIGAGSGGTGDLNLDTNSGIISRLTYDGTAWSKLDLVRGLPRSEENHASNGMQLDEDANILYLAQGGNTNLGAPSNNLAFITEYALAGAILSIDLSAIEALPTQTDAQGHQFKYDLPTLDDPLRANVSTTSGFTDPNDPFGGNDGLNQAKIDPNGPVQIFASGYRNAYDLVLTATPGQEGRIYTFDNGGNDSWGGYPANEGPEGVCTNEYLSTEEGFSNNLDQLHLVTAGAYGGHPAPVRGNPAGAGLYTHDGSTGIWRTDPADLPVDWPPVPTALADAIQCDYQQPGVDDSALLTLQNSTNGLAEYTATNFSGAMTGHLLAASYSGDIYDITLTSTGDDVASYTSLASGFGSIPLDVTAQGDTEIFGGTVWSAVYSDNKVSVFEPDDYDGSSVATCTGADDNTIDEDGDGYTNADELTPANDTNPCSAASKPTNFDAADEEAEILAGTRDFLVSDVNDPDDDNDGVSDSSDPYPIDPQNGLATPLPVEYDFFNNFPGTGFYGLGFTGLMVDGSTDYLQLLLEDDLIAGGTSGLFTISPVREGTAEGTLNTQKNAMQFGVAVDSNSDPFLVTSQISAPFFSGGTPQDDQSQGIYIGTGHQDDYVSVRLHANGGAGGIQVVSEDQGAVTASMHADTGLLNASVIGLTLSVDPAAGTAQAGYQIDGGSVTEIGAPMTLPNAVLQSLQSATEALAAGLIATSAGTGPEFAATWDKISVTTVPSTAQALVSVTPTEDIDASTYSTGSFVVENTSTGGETITRVAVGTAGALLPDVVFDPENTAGDISTDPKPYASDEGGATVGETGHSFSQPHNGVDGEDGYEVLEVTFSDFQPGEVFKFSADIDPNNIKGVASPSGSEPAGWPGSVSGLELTGGSVTVAFSDGSVRTVDLFGASGSVSESNNVVRNAGPVTPVLEALGVSSGPSTVTSADQTVRISAPVGSDVVLMVTEAKLYLDGVPNGGYQLEPYDANTVLSVSEHVATVGSSGYVDVPVQLTRTDPEAGYNYMTAAIRESDGMTGPTSEVLVLLYEPAPEAVTRLSSAASATYTDGNGDAWSVDQYYAGESTASTGFLEIAGTTDDELYYTRRWGAQFSYDIPVPADGTYSVRVHMAEPWFGVTGGAADGGVGDRIFSLDIEGGQAGFQDYDLYADAGPATAVIKTFDNVTVSDGALTLAYTATVNNAIVSAIEVLSSTAGTGQYTIATTVEGSGSVAKNPDQSSYALNDVVELTATPDAGWAFSGWSGDLTGTTNPASVTVTGDMAVTATFVPTYVINVTTVGSGTVSRNPDQQAYALDETVELTAEPASGWVFAGWTGDLTSLDNPLIVTMTSDVNLTATFTEQTAEAGNFVVGVQVEDAAAHRQVLRFGTNQSATDGFDASFDEKAPPAPPSGAFGAHLQNPADGSTFWTDIRAGSSISGVLEWRIHFHAASGATPLEISWDPSLLPAGLFRLQDVVDGSQVDVNMRTRSRYAVADGTLTQLRILYTVPEGTAATTVDTGYDAGWNLKALPLDVGSQSVSTVYPEADTDAFFGFRNGAYERPIRMGLARGYWMNFPNAGTQSINGYPVGEHQIELPGGWSLVSPPSCEIPLPLTTEQDPSGVVTTVYTFSNGAYATATSLSPGQGYWMQAASTGVIEITCGTTSAKSVAKGTDSRDAGTPGAGLTALNIEDGEGASQTLYLSAGRSVRADERARLQLPPVPPEGAFDVRFEDDSRVSTTATSRVRVQFADLPLRLSLPGGAVGPVTVTVLTEGGPGISYALTEGNSVELFDASITGLEVTVQNREAREIPSDFELYQSYPNPFNPTATIAYDVKSPVHVRLGVYNLLGQEVRMLVDEPREPGRYTAVFNASGLTSGMYVYVIEMGSYRQTRTMTLLK